MDGLLLEDGSGALLLEDGSKVLLEQQVAPPVQSTGADALLLEDGSGVILLEDGVTRLALESEVARQVGVPTGWRKRRHYYVRVGHRTMRVDPDNAQSLRALYQATEEEAARVARKEARKAAQKQAEPQDVAADEVTAEPPRAAKREPAIDYAALQAEADKISAQVRKLFAQAYEREMIARLMREQIAREDDDDAAIVLLMD